MSERCSPHGPLLPMWLYADALSSAAASKPHPTTFVWPDKGLETHGQLTLRLAQLTERADGERKACIALESAAQFVEGIVAADTLAQTKNNGSADALSSVARMPGRKPTSAASRAKSPPAGSGALASAARLPSGEPSSLSPAGVGAAMKATVVDLSLSDDDDETTSLVPVS